MSLLGKIWSSDSYHVITPNLQKCEKAIPEIQDLRMATVERRHIPKLIEFWPASLGYLGNTPVELENMLETRLEKGNIGAIAMVQKKIIAMTWLSCHDFQLVALNGKVQKDIMCRKNTYVAPEYRRSGMAIRVFNYIQDIVLEKQIKKVIGFIQFGNTKSLNLSTLTFGSTIFGTLVFQRKFLLKQCYFIDNKKRIEKKRYPKKGDFIN